MRPSSIPTQSHDAELPPFNEQLQTATEITEITETIPPPRGLATETPRHEKEGKEREGEREQQPDHGRLEAAAPGCSSLLLRDFRVLRG